MPEDLRPPGVGHKECGQDPHEGCLAGAIWAEQSEHRSGCNLKVDASERDRRAEALDHALDTNRGSGRRRLNHLRQTLATVEPDEFSVCS